MGSYLAVPENPQPAGIHRELPLLHISQPQKPEPWPEYQPSPPLSPSVMCEICVESIIEPPTQIFQPNNKKCGPHAFCNNCVAKYIQSKLDENTSKIPCPAPNCSEFLHPHDCRLFITPRLFVRWCDSLCDSAVEGLEKCYCPNRNCSVLILNECGENVTKSACPNCKLAFCFQCKLPWHAGFRCRESRNQNDRDFVVLANKERWRSCPNCHQYVERTGGCESMLCRCRTRFCYKCGRKIPPPNHSCIHCSARAVSCAKWCIYGLMVIASPLILYLTFCLAEGRWIDQF